MRKSPNQRTLDSWPANKDVFWVQQKTQNIVQLETAKPQLPNHLIKVPTVILNFINKTKWNPSYKQGYVRFLDFLNETI